MASKNFLIGLIVAQALLLVACTNPTKIETGFVGFSFIVMGDTPYSDDDITMLNNAIPLINDSDYPFVIHIGDYKGGGAECTDDHDLRQLVLIET